MTRNEWESERTTFSDSENKIILTNRPRKAILKKKKEILKSHNNLRILGDFLKIKCKFFSYFLRNTFR